MAVFFSELVVEKKRERTSVSLRQLIDFVLQSADIVVVAGRAAIRALARGPIYRRGGGDGMSEGGRVSVAGSV